MHSKASLVAWSEAILSAWESYLNSRSQEEVLRPYLPGGWSVKDVLVHLMAWQKISTARMQAALSDGEPNLPPWLGGADPFYAEEHTAEFNARILDMYARELWSSVHRAWRDGFLRLIELSRALPEQDMFDAEKYRWLMVYPPSAVVAGSCAHHEEHLAELTAA